MVDVTKEIEERFSRERSIQAEIATCETIIAKGEPGAAAVAQAEKGALKSELEYIRAQGAIGDGY